MRCLANLDFEYELAGRVLDPALFQRWRHIMRLLPQARQAQCLDPVLPGAAAEETLLPWGVTPRVRKLAPQQDWPDPSAVELVNDKRFSHQLEKELGIALPGACLVHSLAELEQAVQDCPHDWVLKHPLGFSARERALGKRGKISDSGRGWARKQLARWSLIFEPWVELRQDFSMHFQAAPDGSLEFLGYCRLVGDPSGVYRGNLVIPGQDPLESALAHGWEIARRVAGCGYWGPIGIDAFESLQGVRPLVEINARYSFGRLTLALKEWAPADGCLLWWHPRQSVRAQRALTRGAQSGIYNLPVVADPEGTSGTVVILAASPEELENLRLGLTLPAQ